MACDYAIEVYGPDADALPRIVDEAFDEVDRIDRLMSHYKATESPVAHQPRGRAPTRRRRTRAVRLHRRRDALSPRFRRRVRHHRRSTDEGVGLLSRRRPRALGNRARAQRRRHVGAAHVLLDPVSKTIRFDQPGLELDLGGIAKGYAVDRVVALLRRRQVAAALISAGGSTIYGLGAPPGRRRLGRHDPGSDRSSKNRVHHSNCRTGRSRWPAAPRKSFEAGGVTYSHIMDPRTGRPVQGVLSVAVLANSGTAGDALDTAFFVLGPDGSRPFLHRLRDTEAMFFLPDPSHGWTVVREKAARLF